MRTTKTQVTFHDSFTLNRNAGELPAGSYDVEIDEDEIVTTDRTGYRRTAIYFFVKKDGSTRMLSIEPAEFESALRRDEEKRAEPSCRGSPVPHNRSEHGSETITSCQRTQGHA